jgi:hypothetical protein
MKRIALAVLAGTLSLSALALGAKEANAADPCAPTAAVQPAGYYGNGYYAPGPVFANRRYELQRERAWRIHQRELARRRWQYNRGY